LGNTLTAIAGEKAGIIKPGIPAVIGEYNEETKPVFINKAAEGHSPLYFASDETLPNYESDLKGDYQTANKKTVLQTLKVIAGVLPVSEKSIKNGLLHVVKNTGFLGRWTQIHSHPTVICDTAHNTHGLKIVMNQVQNQKFDVLRIVFGMVNDKDLPEILPLLPKNAVYYFCAPNNSRKLDENILQREAATFGRNGNVYNSVSEAYKTALADADENDFIYVGGSTFVVAEIL
jgi:dihydrofolate synthase/folylpolyglutamate synthase